MVIEINKDIDKYQESVALGLTAKQLIYSVVSVAVGGGLVFLIYPYIGLTGSAYVVIPIVAPIALGGFYSYNGMSFYEVMRKKLHFMFGNRALTYVSTEGEPAIRAYEFEKANALKTKKLFGFGKKNFDDISTEDVMESDNSEESDQIGSAERNNTNQAEFEATKKKMKKMLIICVIFAVMLIAFAISYKLGYLGMAKEYLMDLVNRIKG